MTKNVYCKFSTHYLTFLEFMKLYYREVFSIFLHISNWEIWYNTLKTEWKFQCNAPESFKIWYTRLVKVTNVGDELQSQNRVDSNYGKTTSPIYLKFWQKFLLQSTIEIQK